MQNSDDVAGSRIPTVAGTILLKFFEALGEMEGFKEVAPKLQSLIIDDGIFAETAIRAALFGEIE